MGEPSRGLHRTTLFEEIDRLQFSLDEPAKDFAEHVKCRLTEILERSGVTIIVGESLFDHVRHQSETPAGDVADNTPSLKR